MRPLSACIACRDRRKKCNRSRPGLSCKFCIRRGLTCIASVNETPAVPRATVHDYQPLDVGIQESNSRQLSSLLVPDEDLSLELVELYFRYAHIAFHNLFHRPTFIARVKDRTISRALLFGVASLSARYSEHPVFASIPPWDRGRPYRDETKRLLDLERTCLTSIQICALLAASSSVEGDPKTESVYQAIAFRMAILLDLPNMSTASLLEREVNRRVWWSLIAMETWASASHALPRFIKPRDDVPLPMEELKFLALTYEDPIPTHELESPASHDELSRSIVAQMVRLNILLYDVIVFNTQVVQQKFVNGADFARTHELALSLDQWTQNMSPDFTYSAENVALWTGAGLGPMFVILHINYNYTGQLLFYQYLHAARDAVDGVASADAAVFFAERCKQHATKLCDIIYDANQNPDIAIMYPLAGHILCLSSTVQIHTLLFSDDEDQIQAAKVRLERNFELISSMNNFWPTSHKSVGRLELFHSTCLKSKDDSFHLDAWLLRFLLGFTQDLGERDAAVSDDAFGSPREFDALCDLLDL